MTERAITRDGYAKIATLMAQVPETAVFRRFGELNARNLLYMQAELVALENKLQRYSREDCMSREAHRQDYGLDWQTLQDSVKDDASEGHDSSQWSTMLQIRAALEKYNAALLQQSKIVKLLEKPHPRVLDHIRDELDLLGIDLTGEDSDIWSEKIDDEENPYLADLVGLTTGIANDPFTRWISYSVLKRFHRLIGRFFKKAKNGDDNILYDDDKILTVARQITTVIACLLPVLSIVILYYIESLKARLGVLAALSAVFAICMNIFTSAEMAAVFAATAGFTAVCVVFVGSTATPNAS